MPYNKSKKYGLSGAVLASETGSKVLPVSHNAGKFWKRRGWIKKSGCVDFVIGEPVETRGLSLEEINKISKEWIDGNVLG